LSLESDLIACDRETGLSGSLEDYCKIAWPHVFPGSPLVWTWHMSMMCEHYEAVFRGEIPELVVNIPPGSSKSSITSVLWPTWGWARKPADSWAFAAYGQKIHRRDADMSVSLMKSRWYKDRWGDRFELPNVTAIDLIKNDKTGFRLGTTPGGEALGFHFNFQIIDDPIKPEELTKVNLEAVREWQSRTMSSRWRRPPERTGLVLIMQRLHCDDLSQFLVDRGAVHLMLPANFDPLRKCVTKWGSDPRTKVKELLDPVRLPQKAIDKLRRDLGGVNAAAQLQQQPVPEGGAIFKREFLKFWNKLPQRFDQKICSWDCSFKAEADSDYVAGQVWGRIGANFYLIEQVHGHFDFPATVYQVLAMAKRHPDATAKLVEDKANGIGVVQVLAASCPGVVAVDPRGGKHARASASAALIEAGNVWLPHPEVPGHEWVDQTFLPEVLSFPRSKNDDQVDCMTQALLYLQGHANYLKGAMEVVRKAMGFRVDDA
jgi:predicted phage terminase large subunit-like protein